MDRRDFIMNSCMACISATALAGVLSSCNAVSNLTGRLNNDGLILDAEDFKSKGNNKYAYHSFIIVRNEALQFPIYVYRFSDTEYTAVWMQCTHQGAELQASGDYLHCPAHGSEFDSKGKVMNGPADKNLRNFPVTVTNNEIFIDLRKK